MTDKPLTPPQVIQTARQANIDGIKNAFALYGKNVGCSVVFRGRIVLVNMLVNDGESHWDEESVNAYVEMLKNVSTELMEESCLNTEALQIAYAYCTVDIPYVAKRSNDAECVSGVLRQFGYDSVQAYQKHYEEKFERDEAVITFAFNKSFRSYAQTITVRGGCSDTPIPEGDEYSMVSFDPSNPMNSQRTFKHELLHQFGAIDYYYPTNLQFKANKHFPDSVMDSGNIVDPLTRYIIGWDEELSDKAKDFLKDIENITAADVDRARTAEWQST